ncbi:uncharacterized protein TNCT_430951 [Trichonephila clavata]|uniref:Uncharacterized protein n=1 Tax=Trichonephila clavata TaxID=2740835 RepID=A0A8X6FGS9_TRICU|nr:uncharacterized protein TNCT_430951 [Trichonephila clavata]
MALSSRRCKHLPDDFCYICGEYSIIKTLTRSIIYYVRQFYLAYYDMKLGDQDKSWGPHKVCVKCRNDQRFWLNGKKTALLFGIPMAWRKPKKTSGCYF